MARTALLLKVTVFSVGIIISGCGKEGGQVQTKGTGLSGMPSSDEELLRLASENVIGNFSAELKASLLKAMNEGGALNALGVCYEKAPEIAMAHSDDGWSIMRVAERYRNPNNRADSLELEILHRFEDTTSSLSFVAQWDSSGEDSIFRYYRPIYTGEICLNCHGPRDKLRPAVAAKIKELYPGDRAVGFGIGELRGLFVVEVAWPRGREYAREIISSGSAR